MSEEGQTYAGKFDSVEKLETAYRELEQKLGQQPDWRGALQSLIQEGKVTDEAKAAELLGKAGLTLDDFETFQAGAQARAQAKEQALLASVGGQESYEQMTKWAAENLPEDQIQAFNETLKGGDAQATELAILRVHAQYAAASGQPSAAEPSHPIQGRPTAAPSVQPFSSPAEMDAAMDDPRYLNDQGYRAEVEARLKVS